MWSSTLRKNFNFYFRRIFNGCLYFLASCLALSPSPQTPVLDHNLYLPDLAPVLYLLALAQIFIYRSWSQIYVYRPGLLFYQQSGIWVLHIPTLFPQFVFVFTALAYDLYYRFGAWLCLYVIIGSSSSGSCNSSSNSFFGIDNTNIFMPILAN